MSSLDKFLKSQKILRLATIGKNKMPHIVPVWYMYSAGKIYIGTNTKTQKAKNIKRNNQVSCCVDVGINSPDICGAMAQGNANIILDSRVKKIATKILLRYFDSMNKSAMQLLDDTDCIIEIIPQKWKRWNY